MIERKELERLLKAYIEKNFEGEVKTRPPRFGFFGILGSVDREDTASYGSSTCAERRTLPELDKMDFRAEGETFSEMLVRLIEESGEKNSAVYNRANIDRRHFSKIVNHVDYKPTKETVLAFALALRLDFDGTRKLLDSAGFTLTNSILSDVIVSFFIEYKIFDLNLTNAILYKYDLPLLGG